MPSGLDGNPNPIVTVARNALLDEVAARVLAHAGPRTLVAVDGQSGSGKSTFADELAQRLSAAGRSPIRSTTDFYHRPRSERSKRGASSAEGYYFDSHQLGVIVDDLLRPFSEGALEVRTAVFDEPSDSALDIRKAVTPAAILIFDGLFVQRPEFASFWDVTIFLEAGHRRDREWLDFLLDHLPIDSTARAAALDERLAQARWPRYRDGWRIYLDAVQPGSSATLVVDNNDFRCPVIL